jgi:hypothetical protein
MIPLTTAIHGRNFVIPNPIVDTIIPIKPKIAIRPIVTKRPNKAPWPSLLTEITFELPFFLSYYQIVI